MIMKAKLILLLSLFLFGFHTPSEAQIFKKLKQKVEKKIEERIDRKEREADRKIDQTIDKGLDKTEEGVKDAAIDIWESDKNQENTSSSSSTVNASGTIKDLPNNTLGENYTIEVSGSGPDVYMEYRMTTNLANQEGMSGIPEGLDLGDFSVNIKAYSSTRLKRSRSEAVTKIPIMGKMTTITLINSDDPNRVVVIDQRNKSYHIQELEDSRDFVGRIEIEKLGTEVVHGLKTTHIKIKTENSDENIDLHMWTSRDIPGYEHMLDFYQKSNDMGGKEAWKKLANADADGYVVKLEGRTNMGVVSMDLINIAKAEFSESLFKIPAGYKEKNVKTTTNPFGK